MNLTKLKNYAPEARKTFIEAVTRRAGVVGVHRDRVDPVTESGDVALIGGQPFPRTVVPLRQKLIDLIQRDGFDLTMEAMAYTWFNRLVALRYMELHDGYLDHGYRVLSHPEGGSLPEILQHAEHVTFSGLNRDEVIRLKLAGDRDEELYRLLLLAQCQELNLVLPSVFSRLDDATVLLLPDHLLHSDSVIRQLVNSSGEVDWLEVEVLGWIYQFYISDKKDTVMARKSAVPTEDIPAVTQLFTPHWIVRYLVENSLGRLWLLNRPGSRLREHMPYYIEGEAETDFLKIAKPEEIKLLDPASGSGHMLTYAFDLLYLIYEEEGYAATEIPGLILKHNLYGLDICPRAAQLAELALVFKAREKSRRYFKRENFVRPNIIELRDVNFEAGELADYIKALGLGDLFNQPMLKLLHQFEEAKNFGSLIQPCLDERLIGFARRAIEAKDLGGQLFLRETHLKVLRVLEQAEMLTQRYHVVVANPPYLGGKQFNPPLKAFGKRHFPDSRADFFSMFIERSYSLVKPSGYSALVTMESWMFLSSFESFRVNVLSNHTTLSMVHMPYLGRGGTSMGINFGTTAAIWHNAPNPSFKGQFQCIRYFECDADGVPANFPTRNDRYGMASSEDFLQVSGAPVAYWVTDRVRSLFKSAMSFKTIASPKVGMQTANNAKYLRFWFEIKFSEFKPSQPGTPKWVKYLKGGPFRRWYGNLDYLLRYNKSPEFILSQPNATLMPLSKLKEPKCTWTDLTSGTFSCRLAPDDSFHDISGHCFYPSESEQKVLLGLSNTKVFAYFLSLINSSFHFQVGDVGRVPVVLPDNDSIESIVKDALSLSISDWDNFETSWDFRDLPLLRSGLKGATLEASWRDWDRRSTAAIRRMQELETENNRLFIAAYGLEGELSPEVPPEQITLARADARKDMAAFLSYALGCMMGRYSLDAPGIILANAGDSLSEYLAKVERSQDLLTFAPDADGIIPVLDGEWFDDDIVARTREFLRATFGEANLTENVQFIEQSLGKDLRSYFLGDFYKDHLQTYKNRPIYWLFSSGKQRAFQCLVYLHRYTPGTLARIRTEYVIPLQGKLSATIARLSEEVLKASTSSARKKLQTDLDKGKKQMVELLAYDEQLRSYADQRIALDLDDGVKVNYAKFGPLVAEAKKICGTKED